jgi:hypothetical protein
VPACSQEIDFARSEITVRDGKGAKDRITMLPETLKPRLRDHLKKVKAIHDEDLAAGWGRVQNAGCRGRKVSQRTRRMALAVGLSAGEQVDQSPDEGAGRHAKG